ncbi:MAG TPA: DUF2382 domain-containing protein [Thermomicrobiales bacterium]|nr:DUF2382 domain-containing protein [Thermomicrobiales bacterium]
MESTNDWVLREGQDVIASDGEKVGEIRDASGESFTVKEGWFFPKEHIIPSSVIASVDEHAVRLSVTKEQALAEEWNAAPATAAEWGNGGGTAVDETTAAGVYGDTVSGDGYTEVAAVETDGVAAAPASPDDRDLTASAAPATTAYASDTTTATTTQTDLDSDPDTIRVPLSEEELVATRHEVDRGTVRVERDVVTEEQSLDVPVTEEAVHVSRRIVDRDVTPGEDAFQEGTIEIPVRGEEVEVEKRAHVTGELDIAKTATTRTEHVTDTVRREEARVVDENGVAIDDGSTLSTDDRSTRRS